MSVIGCRSSCRRAMKRRGLSGKWKATADSAAAAKDGGTSTGRDRIPGPVGLLGVAEDDARIFIFLIRVAPDVEVPLRGAGRRGPGSLKPRVLVGRVVDDQLRDHADAALVRPAHEGPEVAQRAV